MPLDEVSAAMNTYAAEDSGATYEDPNTFNAGMGRGGGGRGRGRSDHA